MPGSTGSRPPDDQVIARRTRALELRNSGLTYQQVAETPWLDGQLYHDKSTCRRAILEALSDHEADAVDDMRHLEGMRLDALQAGLWKSATGYTNADGEWVPSDLGAVDRVVRIIETRAKLFGLNMPTRLELSGEMDREIQGLVAQLGEDETWNITGVPEAGQVVGEGSLISGPEEEPPHARETPPD